MLKLVRLAYNRSEQRAEIIPEVSNDFVRQKKKNEPKISKPS